MPGSKLLACVVFLLLTVLIHASPVGAHLQKHDAQNRGSHTPRLLHRAPSCPGFNGNSDIYGLGIRLGVYFQWLASWLTNTLSPNEAGLSHTANSIFVLAITIAIATSIASDLIKPVEVYVMLLICFGFFFTVLSFLGIRLYFLTPASIAKTIEGVRRSCGSWYGSRKGRWKRTVHSVVALMVDTTGEGVLGAALGAAKMFTLDISFTSASSVKHRALSWSGVVWRTAIASMVASINIYLWWSPWRSLQNAADATQCDTLVYFFGRQELSPAMITFFKVASIVLAVPIFYLFIVLYQILLVMLQLTYEVVLHRIFGSTFGDSRLFRSWDKLPEPLKKYFFGTVFVPMSPIGFNPLLDILEAYLNSSKVGRVGIPPNQALPEDQESPPSISDLLKAYIGFLSRGTEDTEGAAPSDTQVDSIFRGLCLVFHAVLLATMACFITFIELTLTANSIFGVYTLRTTGQLIPFIIGITSLAAAMRELALRHVRKQHPDYAMVSLAVDLGAGTGRIEMRQKGSNSSAPDAVHGTQTAPLRSNNG